MSCEQIAELLPDYLQGSLSEASRGQVESHLEICNRCKEDVALWKKLALLPEEAPSPELRSRFRSVLDAYQEGRWEKAQLASQRLGLWSVLRGGSGLRMPALGLAGAVVLLAIGFFAGQSFNHNSGPSVQQIEKMQAEVSSMKQLVVLSLLQQQSAGERLKAISWSMGESRPDPKVLGALLHTLKYDTSVDVRLAALDALSRYHGQPEVHTGLSDALETQQSPLVQVALIDLMVEKKDSSVVQRLKKIEEDPNVNPTVRQHAQWGIRQLT